MNPDDELLSEIKVLSARLMAHRDVVARLLAFEALRSPDPDALFRDVSDATDHRIYGLEAGREMTDQATAFQEKWRAEVDWLVGAAMRMISAERGS